MSLVKPVENYCRNVVCLPRFMGCITAILLIAMAETDVSAQAISGIITDYNGYWKSSASSNNSTKPVNNHNLLAFTYNGMEYSTGVNDLLLANHGELFTAGDFWSLPIANISNALTSNTKIGVGEMYDGVHNGGNAQVLITDISAYLTDGIKGLNLGTGLANLPAGTISFDINTIQPQYIGDGIPDIVVTQIADPNGSTDSYSFTTLSGTIVGQKKNMEFTSITPVGKWTADFYEAATHPFTLTTGYTNTDRDLRLWAADLSDFGITTANYRNAARFVINLSGSSDIAFVAYNNITFSVQPLPVSFIRFTATSLNNTAQLSWITAPEPSTLKFIVERSTDKISFMAIGEITGNAANTHTFTDSYPFDGINYYRIRMVRSDGSYSYSNTAQLYFSPASAGLGLFPNPAIGTIKLVHPASNHAEIILYNNAGALIIKKAVQANVSVTELNVQHLPPGIYLIYWIAENRKQSAKLVIR